VKLTCLLQLHYIENYKRYKTEMILYFHVVICAEIFFIFYKRIFSLSFCRMKRCFYDKFRYQHYWQIVKKSQSLFQTLQGNQMQVVKSKCYYALHLLLNFLFLLISQIINVKDCCTTSKSWSLICIEFVFVELYKWSSSLFKVYISSSWKRK
jgi:hypothetical protein